MPDQLKQALEAAGVTVDELKRRHYNDLIVYLKSRCSVGTKRIHDYAAWCLDRGVALDASAVYVVCRAYENSVDPERTAARILRCAISDVHTLRREWGVRRRRANEPADRKGV